MISRFLPYHRSKHRDYIQIIKSKERKCKSRIGRQGGKQDLELHFDDDEGKRSCSGKETGSGKGTAIHELMHALGNQMNRF